ncbi:MAG: leishmanolysin-related zinc metalloendopeptidase [Microthrixaceae bacterium]
MTATASYSVGPGPDEPYDIDAQLVSAPDQRVTAAIADAVTRWSATIVRGVPDAVVHQAPRSCTDDMPGFDGSVDDIVVLVVVIPDVTGFMADAAPCDIGPDGLPRLSIIRLDADWIDWLATHDNQLGDLVTHEMGHALGFGGSRWWAYRQELGENDFVFTGPRAVAEWSHLGGSGTVPLSDHGDHWDERIMQNEVMSCAVEYVPTHPLSAVTVAAMADIGYHVDLGASEPWSLPAEPGFMTC